MGDIRRYGTIRFTHVGRTVQYLPATFARPDDRDSPLRVGFGAEAGAVDAARFPGEPAYRRLTGADAAALREGIPRAGEGGAAAGHRT
ncbi:hypothetical protein [Streptomyces sp. NPDC055140]